MLIEKTYVIPFARPRVFAAWVSSDTVIAPAKRMYIEPRLGGAYQLFMDAGATPSNAGRYLEFQQDKRLRYSWEWYGDGNVTEVDVRFTDTSDGTQIALQHGDFSDAESFAAHDAGWDSYVAGLIDFLKAH